MHFHRPELELVMPYTRGLSTYSPLVMFATTTETARSFEYFSAITDLVELLSELPGRSTKIIPGPRIELLMKIRTSLTIGQ
jgi:hypothetical protein